MAHYNTVLHQFLRLVPRHDFESTVNALGADRYTKRFSTWNQLTVLLYAQASGKTSLRDIQNSFAAQARHLNHLGLPDKIAKSTLSDANRLRDYHVYERLFYLLQQSCLAKAPRHKFKFKNPLYSLDSTTIELCLSLFPWSKINKTRGALKIHYGIDHSGNIPTFMTVTEGQRQDIAVAKAHAPIIPDSINCFDRGFVDFAWYRRIHDEKAFFVTRARRDLAYRVVGQQELSLPKGLLFDRTIELTQYYARKDFPFALRLIGYYEAQSGRYFEFLTNNFKLSAFTIAEIYKARWQIETFFKWIKQNLRIKTFLGTSKNAVLTQIWAAMCYLLLLSYIKFQAKYSFSLFYLHRIVGETILDRLSILDLLHLNERRLNELRCRDPQLCLQF